MQGVVPRILVRRVSLVPVLSDPFLLVLTVSLVDSSPQNILMAIEDDSSLRVIEKGEKENPSIPVLAADGPGMPHAGRVVVPSTGRTGIDRITTIVPSVAIEHGFTQHTSP